ncbi:sulfur oxidation c-type cytochrome SoxA [Limibaculum sp. M0105]|uniref:SoxAX cytochrome complex subunit A n=1 Tax=Thermohalobaculum xanthum TaxID=2753746 RepID=A0A8J7M533_9RHOB|nr:sulfur oxidation c-type cytochrome SoxA [Thermohalobaculum xanthum]MBK0398335.1 sulfur oxidation c-type cytochrome SoxA [Thermohalobaculum xanthum]
MSQKYALIGALTLALAAGASQADPVEDTLVVNGEIEMTTVAPAPEHLGGALDVVRSGWLYRGDETRDMQRDDFENPAMLYVEAAATAWSTPEGTAGKSCADCHGDPESMRGLRASVPKVNPNNGELWAMEQFVNGCRTERMGAEAWKWDSQDMRNMTALLSSVSRGLPVNVAIDGPAAPFWEQGKEIYYTRYGQLELACANCHEDNNGRYIRADHLSQGQTNGFPVYRLKQTNLVSLHNRFRGCIRDTRAEPFEIGSPEFVALELYVASRGQGLSIEGPSVRQ